MDDTLGETGLWPGQRPGASEPAAVPGARPGRGGLWGMLDPASVAVVGASRREDSLGGRLLPILRQHGFPGDVYPVNPSRAPVGGERSFASVSELPAAPDVALVAVAARAVPGVIEQCAAAGVRHAVVLSSGFGERRDVEGAELQAALDTARRPTGMRVLGPNCEGFLNVAARAALSFSPTVDLERALRRLPVPGGVAIVSQSGGLGFALFNDGTERGLRFSHVVSTGNECDVDATEVLELLAGDPATSVVLCFIEGLSDPLRFAEAARRARQAGTAVVLAKVGRSPAAARASLAHTAHDVGDEHAWSEAVDAAACLVASDQEELVDLGMALARAPRWRSGGVAVLTISGGAGAWAADACFAQGLDVPLLDAATRDSLRGLMPSYGSPDNPVDVTAGALSTGGLVRPLEILLARPEIGAALVVGSFGGPKQLEIEGEELGRVVSASGKPVVVYSYTRPGTESVGLLGQAGLAWYPTAARAARALAALRS